MRVNFSVILLVLAVSLGTIGMLHAQTNLLPNGDLETMEPAFWTKVNDGLGGAQVIWAQDEAAQNPWGPVPSYWSFKVVKSAVTTDAVGWRSVNNADLYWNNAAGNVLYTLRYYVKTSGVNTNPGNDDARIGVWYRFYAGGNLLAEKLVAVDQSVSTKDWDIIQDALLVPSEPEEVYAVAVMGKDATGTVWFDNIDCWTDPWSMGMFNGDAETPVGWMYWSASDAPNFCGLVGDTAHSGSHSALLYEKDNADDEMVFYSAPIPAEPDKWYRLSVWIKTDSMNTDPDYVASNVTPDRIDERMGVCFFFHRGDIDHSWDLTGGDQYFYADQRNASSDWTLYSVVAKSPSDAAGVSIRARFTSFPTGYAWFDDFMIEELQPATNLLPNGDLETMEPAFWTKVNDGLGGAQVIWAQDEAAQNPWGPVPSYWSFKVVKSAVTTDAVGWRSVNNADLYWNNAAGNVLYTLRYYVKTSGVNTNPGNDDARIGVWYRFYAGGNLLAEKLVAVDQSVSTKDWDIIQDALLVPSEPEEVYAVAVMGKDATGTVWFDNIDCWTDPWSMGMFNGDAETPVGWMYWSASDAPNFCGLVGDTAHSGSHSALLYEKDNADDEMVFYSAPIPAEPDKWYRLSVWIKTDSMNTDPDYVASNVTPDRIDERMGVCFFFHRGDIDHSWDLTGGDQYFYADQRNASSDWTLYSVVAKSPSDAAGVSIRARFTSFPTGYAWFDDFRIFNADAVVSIEDPETPVTYLSHSYQLNQNYPNPFNPETIIEYRVPERGKVELNIYNMLGQKIRTLVNQDLPAGTYQVLWDGKDDIGNIVASGIYLYQLRGTNAFITKKMTFMK